MVVLKAKLLNKMLKDVTLEELRVIKLLIGRGTVTILPDRVRLMCLTVDPTVVEEGDVYYRSDIDRIKFAIDTVPANAKTMPVVPITTGDIADGAITTPKIATDAVTAAKIAAGAVGTSELADLAVTTAKLADTCVTTTKINDGAVTGAKIAAGAVGTTQLADLSVTTAKIADGAVTDAKITAPISPGKIGTGNLNLGTGTLTCGQVTVGDIVMRYGWAIKETENAIVFLKDGREVFRIPGD